MGRIFRPTNIVKDKDGKPVLDEHGQPVRRARTQLWYVRYYDANGEGA